MMLRSVRWIQRTHRYLSTRPLHDTTRTSSVQGVQGDLEDDQRFTMTTQSNKLGVSAQGVQGDDCASYQLWQKNCQQLGDCNQQLTDVKPGQKTVAEIFAAQDLEIRQAAEKWRSSGGGLQTDATSDAGDGSQTEATPDAGDGLQTDATSGPVMSRKDRLKRAVKDYGSTVVVFHVTISLLSLGGFYVLVSSGVNVVALMKWLDMGEAMVESRLASGASVFVLAYAVHKVFAPVRIAITLTCVPFIVRYLRRINVLKKT